MELLEHDRNQERHDGRCALVDPALMAHEAPQLVQRSLPVRPIIARQRLESVRHAVRSTVCRPERGPVHAAALANNLTRDVAAQRGASTGRALLLSRRRPAWRLVDSGRIDLSRSWPLTLRTASRELTAVVAGGRRTSPGEALGGPRR